MVFIYSESTRSDARTPKLKSNLDAFLSKSATIWKLESAICKMWIVSNSGISLGVNETIHAKSLGKLKFYIKIMLNKF